MAKAGLQTPDIPASPPPSAQPDPTQQVQQLTKTCTTSASPCATHRIGTAIGTFKLVTF